jgi:hypothetical protein
VTESSVSVAVTRPEAASTVAVKHRMPIAEAFEKGMGAFGVQLSADGKGVVLSDRAVIEDDAAGACAGGVNWAVPRGRVGGKELAKKVLRVERPAAGAFQLVIFAGANEGETAPLVVKVNGHKFIAQGRDEESGDKCLQIVDLRQRIIRAGDNEVILSCDGSVGWWVGMGQREDILRNAPDRHDRPVRSFRSADRGKTWRQEISSDGRDAGEYMVRLNLDQYAAKGELLGPVIDLAELAGRKTILPPTVEVACVTVTAPALAAASATAAAAASTSGTCAMTARRTGPLATEP